METIVNGGAAFLGVLGQGIMRLGLFLLGTFLAVALGFMDYLLIKDVLPLLPSIGQLGLEFAFVQILILVSGTAVIVVDGGAAVVVFLWGLGFEVF